MLKFLKIWKIITREFVLTYVQAHCFLRHFSLLLSLYYNHWIRLHLLIQFWTNVFILSFLRIISCSLLCLLAICTYVHSFSAQERHEKARLPHITSHSADLLAHLKASSLPHKSNWFGIQGWQHSAEPTRSPENKAGTKGYCAEHDSHLSLLSFSFTLKVNPLAGVFILKKADTVHKTL